jgi:uncharacterized protein YukE
MKLGMDVDEVERVGHSLNQQADAIGHLISTVEGLVNSAHGAWQGNDSNQFLEWWHSQHRPALQQAEQAIRGLGQSAVNNAQDQRAVSGH